MVGKKSKFKIIDLFAGVGGISVGFKKAGFEIAAANEYKADIANTYVKNHPEVRVIVEDIAKIKSKDLVNGEKIDVIVGGPPCQGFSMAGRRIRNYGAFMNDTRNELFKEFHRIVKEIRPKVFVMENVAAILNIHRGAVKKEILQLFKETGYETEARVLLAAEYGVPQLRRRVVFIGNRLGIDPKEFFPKKTHGPKTTKPYVTVAEAILDLPKIESGLGEFESKYLINSQFSQYQKERRGRAKKLYNHQATQHEERILKLLKTIKPGQGRVNIPKELQTKSVHSGAFGRLEKNKPAYTITTRFDTPSVGRVTHPVLHRALTPREAARIQSFDDDFIFYGNKGSVGIQIGNAVPPLLAKAIASKISEILKKYGK
ncbi:MAG: DNA cytosine methyltransferase [Candidatus Liptonbacteria bacterium]|nr:DNA cytosine methyltransferase [Candidatus Liptonbacteria bacterium]